MAFFTFDFFDLALRLCDGLFTGFYLLGKKGTRGLNRHRVGDVTRIDADRGCGFFCGLTLILVGN